MKEPPPKLTSVIESFTKLMQDVSYRVARLEGTMRTVSMTLEAMDTEAVRVVISRDGATVGFEEYHRRQEEEKPEPRLVGLYGLATALVLPAKWLEEEADAGRIPFLQAGKRRLFNTQTVKALLLARAAGNTTPPEDTK